MPKIILVSLCFMLFTGCHKEDQGKDESYPKIVFASPTNNQVFAGGDVVIISANISDSFNGLEQVVVTIYNNATGDIIEETRANPLNGKLFPVNQLFQVKAGMKYKIEIIAINKYGKKETKTMLISAN